MHYVRKVHHSVPMYIYLCLGAWICCNVLCLSMMCGDFGRLLQTTKSEVFVVTEQATSSALPDASRQTTLSTSTLLPTETQSFTTSFVKTAPLNILPDVPPSEIPRLVETTPQRPFPETTPRPASTTTACTTSPPKKVWSDSSIRYQPNQFMLGTVKKAHRALLIALYYGLTTDPWPR